MPAFYHRPQTHRGPIHQSIGSARPGRRRARSVPALEGHGRRRAGAAARTAERLRALRCNPPPGRLATWRRRIAAMRHEPNVLALRCASTLRRPGVEAAFLALQDEAGHRHQHPALVLLVASLAARWTGDAARARWPPSRWPTGSDPPAAPRPPFAEGAAPQGLPDGWAADLRASASARRARHGVCRAADAVRTGAVVACAGFYAVRRARQSADRDATNLLGAMVTVDATQRVDTVIAACVPGEGGRG